MTTWAEGIHLFLRGSHIAVGLSGLLFFWLAILSRKGSKPHRVLGRGFVFAAYYVGGTAILSSLWALLDLETFYPRLLELPVSAQAGAREQYRFLFSILLFLASATVAAHRTTQVFRNY